MIEINRKEVKYWSELCVPANIIQKKWKEEKKTLRNYILELDVKDKDLLQRLFTLCNHNGDINSFIETQNAIRFYFAIEFCRHNVELFYEQIFRSETYGEKSIRKDFEVYFKIFHLHLNEEGKQEIKKYFLLSLKQKKGRGSILQILPRNGSIDSDKVRVGLKKLRDKLRTIRVKGSKRKYIFDGEFLIGEKYYYWFRKEKSRNSSTTISHRIKFNHNIVGESKFIIYDPQNNTLENFFSNGLENYFLKRTIENRANAYLADFDAFFEVNETELIRILFTTSNQIRLFKIDFSSVPASKELFMSISNKNISDISVSINALRYFLEDNQNKIKLNYIDSMSFATEINGHTIKFLVNCDKHLFKGVYKLQLSEQGIGNEAKRIIRQLFLEVYGISLDTNLITKQLNNEELVKIILSKCSLPVDMAKSTNESVIKYLKVYQHLLDNCIFAENDELEIRQCNTCRKINKRKIIGNCQCGSDSFFWKTKKVKIIPLNLDGWGILKYVNRILRKNGLKCEIRKYVVPALKDRIDVIFDKEKRMYYYISDKNFNKVKEFFLRKQSNLILIETGSKFDIAEEPYIAKLHLIDFIVGDLENNFEILKNKIDEAERIVNLHIGSLIVNAANNAYESIRNDVIENGDTYEELSFNILYSSFYYGQLLGTCYRGKSKPDAILYFPKTEKDEGIGAIAWDCKYWNENYPISREIKKQRKYIKDLINNRDIKRRGGLFAYGIIYKNIDIPNFQENYKKIIPKGWRGKIFIMNMAAQRKIYEVLAPHKPDLINNMEKYRLLKEKLFEGAYSRQGFIKLNEQEITRRLSGIFD